MDIIKSLPQALLGCKIARPNIAGTLSGHAAGEPFDKRAYQLIKEAKPTAVYRQFEYLNALYEANPACQTAKARHGLIKSPTAAYLLNRGDNPTAAWTPADPFVEKQNDTADILIVENGHYQIIDIKTHDEGKKAQPPNIISAEKLADMCAIMIDNNDFTRVRFDYIEIQWREQTARRELECTASCGKSLFRIPPEKLYINWIAGQQIQFRVCDIAQDYAGDVSLWTKQYLKHYCASFSRMISKKQQAIKRFERYL